MFLPLSQNCSKRIFLQVKNDSCIRTIWLFVRWHFLGFRICQIRQDTVVSNVRWQFRAWVRHLFWQQSDWPIHRILKHVIPTFELTHENKSCSACAKDHHKWRKTTVTATLTSTYTIEPSTWLTRVPAPLLKSVWQIPLPPIRASLDTLETTRPLLHSSYSSLLPCQRLEYQS